MVSTKCLYLFVTVEFKSFSAQNMSHVECETRILNPDQSNELFQRTENVPSVLIWPSSAQRELKINKWHLVKIAP